MDPQLLNDIMSKVVSLKASFVKGGMIQKSDLVHVLKSYPAKMQKAFIHLLEKFEILYQFPLHHKTNARAFCVVPSMLRSTPPQQYSAMFKIMTSVPLPNDKFLTIRKYKFDFMLWGSFPA